MARNPTVFVNFLNGRTQLIPDLAESSVLYIGPSSGGPINKATRAGQLSSALTYLHGPLVGSGSHHLTYGQPCYLQRSNASTLGTISPVTKFPVAGSSGAIAASLTSYTLHAPVSGVSPLNISSGWTDPGAPLPLTITSDIGTLAHTQTIQGIDEEGKTVSETVNIPFDGGVTTTTTTFRRILLVTSNIAPGEFHSYTASFASPQERMDFRVRVSRGGLVSGSPVQPSISYSFDDGRSYSRSVAIPSTGVLDVSSYAPGLVPQATGVRLTLSGDAEAAQPFFGSVLVPGTTPSGDVIYTALADGVTVAHVDLVGPNNLLSVSVTGLMVEVRLATDGLGDPTISTAAQVVAALALNPFATALVRARVRGTGAGLAGATGPNGMIVPVSFTNSIVNYTARVEGVRIRHVESGTSTPLTVSASGNDVTVTLATDVDGIRTSTATQVAAAIAASAPASALLIAAAGGTGAGLSGDGIYMPLSTTLEVGDEYAFTTTPPSMTTADLQESLAALLVNETVLTAVSGIVALKDGADSSDVLAMQDFLEAARSRYQYKYAILQARYMGSTEESTWLTNVQADYPALTGGSRAAVTICAGETDMQIPAYGTQSRRNSATVYATRLASVPVSELPSHVECETILGTQTSLPGIGFHEVPGTNPVQLVSIWQSDDALVTLNSRNFVTLRTIPGDTGIYIRQSIQYVDDGDDYLYITRQRIANIAAALGYREALRFLQASLLTDPTTGALAENVAQDIEQNIGERIARYMFGGTRRHLVAVRAQVNREIDFASTGTIETTVLMVPLTSVETFTLNIGYSLTAEA